MQSEEVRLSLLSEIAFIVLSSKIEISTPMYNLVSVHLLIFLFAIFFMPLHHP